MKVLYLPEFTDNPYQAQLYRHLARETGAVCNPGGVVFIHKVLAQRPNVVHFHWLHPFYIGKTSIRGHIAFVLFLCQWAILRVFGCRIVWTVHNLKDHEGRKPRTETLITRLVSRAADAIIVHCKTAGDDLRKCYPWIDDKHIRVIPHASYLGVYPDHQDRATARTRLGLPGDTSVVLLFGEIRRYKGVLELLEAFLASDQAMSAILLIAGRVHEPELRTKLQQAADNNNHIRLHLQFIDDDDIQTYMAAADVVATPFRNVLTSGSVILALSFGKAIIAPRTGCIRDLEHEAKGFFYDSDTPDGLKNALNEAFEHVEELASMGKCNRQLASTQDWKTVAQQTGDLFRQLLAH